MGSLIKLLNLSFSSYVIAINLVSAVATGVGYCCGCCCVGIVVIGNAIVAVARVVIVGKCRQNSRGENESP